MDGGTHHGQKRPHMEGDTHGEEKKPGEASTSAFPDIMRRAAVSARPETGSISHADRPVKGRSIESSVEKTGYHELKDLQQSSLLMVENFKKSSHLFRELRQEKLISLDSPPLRDTPLSVEEIKQLAALHEQTSTFHQRYGDILVEAGTLLPGNLSWVQEEQKVAQSMRDTHTNSAYDNPRYSPSGLLTAHRADLSYQQETLMMLKKKYGALGSNIPSEAPGNIDKMLEEGYALQGLHEKVRAIPSREIDRSRLEVIMPVLEVFTEAERLLNRSQSAKHFCKDAEREKFNAFFYKLDGFITRSHREAWKGGLGPFLYAASAIKGEEKWHEIKDSTPPRDLEQIYQHYEDHYYNQINSDSESGRITINSSFLYKSHQAENEIIPEEGEFRGVVNNRYPDHAAEYPPLHLSELVSAQIHDYNEQSARLMGSEYEQNLPPFHFKKWTSESIINRQSLRQIALVRTANPRLHKQIDEYPEGSRGYYAMVLAETARSKFWLARQEGLRCSKVELLEDDDDPGDYNTVFHFTRSRPLPLD